MLILSLFFATEIRIGFGEDARSPGGWLLATIATIPLVWMLSAVSMKRLNDGDRPQWLLGLFWAPLAFGYVDGLLGISEAIGIIKVLPWSILLAGSVWMLIELGFVKGMPGPNRHGHDSLASPYLLATRW
jgi:uncharacterized membrane protein YhaH (DUF805 family)